MTKDELLAQLENHEVSYRVGLSSLPLLNEITYQDKNGLEIQRILSNKKGRNGNLIIDYSIIAEYFTDKERAKKISEEYLKFLNRTFLTECYELVFLYVQKTNQLQKIEEENVFTFMRIIRHAISHDFTINCSKPNFECTWRSLGFDMTMNGLPLEAKHYGYIEGSFKLWEDMYNLVRDKLV